MTRAVSCTPMRQTTIIGQENQTQLIAHFTSSQHSTTDNYFFVLCGKFGTPYLVRHSSHKSSAMYPFLSVCVVFSCVQTMVWLPVLDSRLCGLCGLPLQWRNGRWSRFDLRKISLSLSLSFSLPPPFSFLYTIFVWLFWRTAPSWCRISWLLLNLDQDGGFYFHQSTSTVQSNNNSGHFGQEPITRTSTRVMHSHRQWIWQYPLLGPSVRCPQMVWGCVCACACA